MKRNERKMAKVKEKENVFFFLLLKKKLKSNKNR